MLGQSVKVTWGTIACTGSVCRLSDGKALVTFPDTRAGIGDIVQVKAGNALVVSLLGGLVGLVLSLALTSLLSRMLGMSLTVSPVIAVLAIGFSLVIGVVLGMYPPNKASKLRPVDALRHE